MADDHHAEGLIIDIGVVVPADVVKLALMKRAIA